jgi:enoyl-CoA hydratase
VVDELVHLDRRDDGVALITLDRPKANALSAALLDELADAAQALHDDRPGAVVISGGPKIFAAGAEISEFGGSDEARQVARRIRTALDLVATIPRVTIAAVAGYALGGGCELALACDLRLAHTNARLGQPEILLGVIPGGGGTQRMARLIGPARTKEIVLTGRQVTADEALSIGLVDEVVETDVTEAALERAARFAQGPVLAHGAAKRAIDEGLERPLPEGLDLEADLFVEIFSTEDAATGVQSFLDHGPGRATFSGR